VKGIVLQRSGVDEGTAIGEDNHPVAEHIPRDGLHGDATGPGVKNGRPQVCVRGQISGAGDNQYLAVMQKGGVHWIDGHLNSEGLPFPLRSRVQEKLKMRPEVKLISV